MILLPVIALHLSVTSGHVAQERQKAPGGKGFSLATLPIETLDVILKPTPACEQGAVADNGLYVS